MNDRIDEPVFYQLKSSVKVRLIQCLCILEQILDAFFIFM
ncbi:hypothetical protein VRK_09090 [Vibrio sp. MEBiC08052]|nr:hypothetical protein VRK_09090 [Vibrio sp. MEBiC08052]